MTQQYKSEAELLEALKTITPDVFADFFKEKGITHLTCPICKRGNVTIPIVYDKSQEDSHDYVVPSLTDRLDSDGCYNLANYSYKILCKNCAYEMHFNVSRIISWAEKKGDHDE
ncbi:hypothetical protein B5C26_02410 [Photorhabdus luminescens]|uniref:Uncharacterized protein n=1 Tax=Photorhabdus luminescens subsp. mexicana TaxID=2100167 RepID=A0A4R4J3J9_PHOLU|nr:MULTISPECIES: hypothetical protein [Photorhabdus]MCW7549190.1 hypothetical protein [Photorhabdus aballayi]OWO84764.1 hypothetical protein B5C26_02410 [Photorhabdus luminescens]TDB48088.1 hypothetical protein C5468_16935 [Photorhabdus luminescens subsp. mexicana]